MVCFPFPNGICPDTGKAFPTKPKKLIRYGKCRDSETMGKCVPGWAKWEKKIADLVEPASRAMLDMAGIGPCTQVLDLACGAGSQTLNAASLAGNCGHVVALDISERMLDYVRKNAQVARLDNISLLQGAAEELAVSRGL